ncbi:MAG: sugar phosphate isomerase/epimerase [Verrucomicrobia bacterium]|nr:MAG: sugar phosphate isomerase/epimerase [Verrucomicrobiota bacterium]TAE89233.1 MAG: sugar phosphate isomerase/epimerase [Verrucomicrobiota bacterium]TAF27892.1 MAG: sugar phosphate isomerase/epimerase [Verrucomicrobiota bacterium]TAF42741.1 MAG: sugar phosphate isomerase/epimerase [Verrucomicrobiota bacterium]
MSPDQLAIHTFTNKPWSIYECLENYARRGIGGVSIWRETVVGQDLGKVKRHLIDSGLKPVSLVRGGFFTGKDVATRESGIDANRAALREAEALGLPMIVLVCGATIGQTPEENLDQIRDGIAALLPQAEGAGIRLAIEPLHPMYAGDRSAVASMRDANELAESLNHPLVGVALDVFHVWWESGLEAQIQRCAAADRLFAFHVCEFKPDFDHVLLDRGLPGEGVDASARIARMVKVAGFTGLTEVEIFSRKYWSENQHDFLEKIVQSCEAL